jgi:hypothetical protein
MTSLCRLLDIPSHWFLSPKVSTSNREGIFEMWKKVLLEGQSSRHPYFGIYHLSADGDRKDMFVALGDVEVLSRFMKRHKSVPELVCRLIYVHIY